MELVSGNVFIREMRFQKAGDLVEGHEHNFDHTTYVCRGAMRIERLDDDGQVLQSTEKRATDGRNWVLIKAGVRHRITALDDRTIGHCIYAHRTPQGDVVQDYDGWDDSYV